MNTSTRFATPFLVTALVAFACCQGCSEKMPDGPRVPTFPVVGQILVDGKPAEFLGVSLEPQFEKPQTVPSSGAFTNKDGTFEVKTFESGDGAPAGKYKLTFMWGEMQLLSGQYGGKDKLNGRYRKAANSKHEVTVADQKVDLGKIELTTK